jgi:hypothetical protein
MTNRFIQCANAQAAMGQLSPEWQDVWRETYNAYYTGAEGKMGADAADAFAAQETIKAMAGEVARRQKLLLLQKTSRKRVLDGLEAYAAKDTHTDMAKHAAGLKRVMENLGGKAGGPFMSVHGQYNANVGTFHAMMADVIEKFEAGLDANALGGRARATLDNLVREAFGEDTGDDMAKMLAKSWGDTADYARTRFNDAGGDIAKRADWGMPTVHEAYRVRRADQDPAKAKQAWIDFVRPMINPDKMLDVLTGMPISAERLDLSLSNMFDAIVSEGTSTLKPGGAEGVGKLANRRQDHRFLVFKDADSWMAYQDRFGNPDPYDVMMGHMDMMARDIARMDVLGPDPDRNWLWLRQEVQRRAGLEETTGNRGALHKGQKMAKMADEMHETFKGTYSSPNGENQLAGAMSTTRAYLTAAQLGSAVIPDMVSAPVFSTMARSFTGLPVVGNVNRLAKMFNPLDDTDRAIARRSGFIIETANDALINQAYALEASGRNKVSGFINKLPTIVHRITGNSVFTANQKRAWNMDFMAMLGDNRALSLDDLASGDKVQKTLAQTFKNWGIKPDEWDLIRAAPLWTPVDDAPGFMRSREIEAHIGGKKGTNLAMRLSEMVQQEGVRAVPTPTLYGRAIMLGGQNAGSSWGEIIRSVGQYKGWTASMSAMWVNEMRARIALDGALKGGIEAGVLFAGLVITSGIGMNLREIAKGNEPRHADDDKFWKAAIAQSGGLGILGDFFFAAESRTGGSAPLAALGPMGQLASDTASLANAGMRVATDDQVTLFQENKGDARLERKAVNALRNYAPWGSVWWARAAWDRTVIAGLRKMTDPDVDKFYGLQRRRLAEEDRDWWWAPGESPNPAELLDGSQAVERD